LPQNSLRKLSRFKGAPQPRVHDPVETLFTIAWNTQREGFLDLSQGRLTLSEASTHKSGMVFSFVMDTRLCDGAYQAAAQADLLVRESTYLNSESEEAAAHGHLTAAQAAMIAAGAKVNTLALTHFSQRYETSEGFVEEARPIHANVLALEDGAAVAVTRPVVRAFGQR
jgi:ribonuclease Z